MFWLGEKCGERKVWWCKNQTWGWRANFTLTALWLCKNPLTLLILRFFIWKLGKISPSKWFYMGQRRSIIGQISPDNNGPDATLGQNTGQIKEYLITSDLGALFGCHIAMEQWLPCTYHFFHFQMWVFIWPLLCPYIIIVCWLHYKSMRDSSEKPSLHTILKHEILNSLSDVMIEWDIWECWELIYVFLCWRGHKSTGRKLL